MSIFGALDTAVSGLAAQSQAFTDISNNIANSQTIGYKATDTNFSDYVLNSSASQISGTVVASTASQNSAQGTITSSTNALALAVSGNGFFNVSETNGASTGTSQGFQPNDYYTRNGNFTENSSGYLVNSSNEYLKGYMVDSSGNLNTSSLQTVNVANVAFRPSETGTITYAASLPGATAAETASATGSTTSTPTSQTQTIYDASGAAHAVGFNWSYSQASNAWNVSATVDGASTPSSSAQVTFNASGQIASIAQQTNVGSTPATYGAANTTNDSTASFTIPATLDGTSQTMTVDLGTIGSSSGTTMATDANGAGSNAIISSDSVTSGNYTGITMTSDGSIMATFDNNKTQLVGKVPLATFADSNGLSSQDGQAYTATYASGAASINLAGANGAGNLETSSVESSTTNLDSDLTKLITAQNAYGANAKVVTTANEMLQTVLAMKQ